MVKDPYKYFRIEARELLEGLNQGVLELEKAPENGSVVARLLRLAHTLKGASRVVKQAQIADLAHAAEEVLAPFRDGSSRPPRESINELLRLLDGMAALAASLDQSPAESVPESSPRAVAEDPFQTVRVEIAEVDALLESEFETATQLSALRSEIASIENIRHLVQASMLHRSRRQESPAPGGQRVSSSVIAEPFDETIQDSLTSLGRNLSVRIDRAQMELAQLRARANKLRLLPASVLSSTLERAVRDVAQSLQKRVDFHLSGGETTLDTQVLAALRDVLLHVVRNAVAHGIETEDVRRAAGKQPVGRVELSVLRRGDHVAFLCRDDGRGIDVEAVRRAAVRRGLLASAEASSLSLDDVIRLILKGGVSTAGAVTEVSGRGIGLDVVRDTVARLKGDVKLETEWGRGTTLEVCVPVSLSSLPTLVLEAGNISACIPLDSVCCTLRVAPGDIVRTSDCDSILFEGKAIPFCSLRSVLRNEHTPSSNPRVIPTCIVRVGSDVAAVGVDRFLGTSSVIVRPIPHWVAAAPVVAGAALDHVGQPQLVLDPGALVASARIRSRRAPAKSASPPPILVIDDSLTTRMLEQSILESAGYKVDLATSAEDGLSKARAHKYGLFIVDVEMPGMDGFGFISETRQDSALRAIPSILVTSRNAREDRKRGEDLGARAYIVKSEFDQGYLLKTIRELVG